ncbi:MAG TPA: ATP-binding protein [Trichocoleus sp.]
MNRNGSGQFAPNWDGELKQAVKLSLTQTAWQTLKTHAQASGISRSELVERYARSLLRETAHSQASGSLNYTFASQAAASPGLSAQFAHLPADPEAVYSLTANQLSALLAERTQDLQAENAQLKAQVATLEQTLQEQTEIQNSQRQWLEDVLNLLPTPLVLVDHDLGKVTFSNRLANQLAGVDIVHEAGGRYSEDYYCTDAAGQFIPVDQLPSARAAQGERISGEEIHWHTPMGVFPLLVYADTLVALPDRAATGVVVFQDIRDRKRTEDALRQSEQRLQIALKAARMFVWELACDTGWGVCSEGAMEVWGFQEGPLEEFMARIDPRDRATLDHISQEAIATGTPFSIDYRILGPDGTTRWLSSSGSLQRGSGGQPDKLIGVSVDITQRKQTEDALRQSEDQFRQLANAVPQIVWVINANHEMVYANDHWWEYSGFTASQDSYRQKSLQVIHPDDAEAAYAVWDQAYLEGQPYQHECRLRRGSDGSYRWFLVRAVPAKNDQGQTIGWYGTSTDIDDLKRAEQERERLLASEQAARSEAEAARRQLYTLFETAPIGMALLDHNQRYIAINVTLAEINGLPREAHLGRTPRDLFGQSDPNIVRICDDVYTSGKPFVASNLPSNIPGRKDRRPGYYSVHYLPTPDPARASAKPGSAPRRVESLLTYVTDVTDRFRLEQAQRFLADSSQVLSSSLDYQTTLSSIARLVVPHLADWCTVHIVDEMGVTRRLAVAHVNPDKVAWADELEERYPYDPDQPRGVPEVIRTGRSELYAEIPDHLLVEAAKDEDHLNILREVGFSAAMIVPLQVQGRALGAISFVAAESGRSYDVNDLTLAEELGRRAALAVENARLYDRAQRDRDRAEAANRVKDEFLAVLSHELRSPLNPILGWAGLLRQGQLDGAKTAVALETIERNAKLQAQLIEDLLDVSRILRGKLNLTMAPVPLPSVIEAALETVRLAAEAKAMQLQVQIDPGVLPVLGDAARLQQVIWNLLANAVKFTPAGGHITISLSSQDGQACVQVHDTGQGIAPDFLPHVFEYFRQADSTTTRRFGGLGLGLAIVRHLVELHGGSVEVSSPGLGQGATFTVKLPLQPIQINRAASSQTPGTLPIEVPLAGLRVLLVDDDSDTRDVITVVLEQAGAVVTSAASVDAALVAFDQAHFDVLLSDIGMPGQDGYSLIQQVRTRAPEAGGQVPAIALTAYAGDANQRQALAAGFQRHLSKPVDPAALVAILASLRPTSAPA